MKKKIFAVSIILSVSISIAFNVFLTSKRASRTEQVVEIEPIPVPVVIDIQKPIAASSPITKEFDSLISLSFEKTHLVGAAIAVVNNGKLELLKSFGLRQVNTEDSVDIHTAFRIASVSKGFAGILGGLLHNNGTLSLDDKVIDYLEDFKLQTSMATNNVSLRNILSQSTGLESHAYDNYLNESKPFHFIYKHLGFANVCGEPGKYYGYQNAMYGLFDTLVATKTNISYSQLLMDSIFKPLNMIDASTGFEAFCNNDNIAYPHKRGRKEYVSQQLNSRYYSTLSAAGVNASISDMSLWLMALLGNNETVISKGTLDTVFNPHIRTVTKRSYFHHWRGMKSGFYGLGWMVLTYKDNTIIYHRGFVDGYKAEIAFCREKNIGIVYLTNSPNSVTFQWVPLFFNMYLQ